MLSFLLCCMFLGQPDIDITANVWVEGNIVYYTDENGIVYAYKLEAISEDAPLMVKHPMTP